MADLVPQFKLTKADTGVWVVDNPDSLAKFKQGAKPGDYFLSIAPPKKLTRSIQQNRFYWGVIVKLLSEHLGHTHEEIHAIFCDMFLPVQVIIHNGIEIKFFKSTTKLTVDEFSGFIELCSSLAASEGVVIPEIEEVSL